MGMPDNGPVVVGVTWWLTFFCGAFLGLRICAKMSRKRGLWWDDHVLIASWVLLFVQAIMTQVDQLLGFGKRTVDIPVENITTLALTTSVTATISFFALAFSKISFGVTLLRLTTGGLRWFIWFCIVTLFLVMIPSVLITWIRCNPTEKASNDALGRVCWHASIIINYGIFNAAWRAAADFALALLPWKLVWGLRLNFCGKIGVGIAMSMGVFCGFCAIITGVCVTQLRQQDFYFYGKDIAIWTVAEIATAIIAASIPILRAFFNEAVVLSSNSQGPSQHHSSSKPMPLSTLNRDYATTSAGKGRVCGWMTIEDGVGDDASRRGISRDKGGLMRSERGMLCDEEKALQEDSMVVVEHEDNLRKGAITIAVDEDKKS